MKLSGVFRLYTSLKLNREGVATDKIEPPDTRIFSPRAVAGLCVTIGRYWYLLLGPEIDAPKDYGSP